MCGQVVGPLLHERRVSSAVAGALLDGGLPGVGPAVVDAVRFGPQARFANGRSKGRHSGQDGDHNM